MAGLVVALVGAQGLALGLSGASASASPPPLGPGRITELAVGAVRLDGAGARTPLALGDSVSPGERVRTADGEGTRLELTFADGSLVRLGPASELEHLGQRRVELRAGRMLAHSDLMRGGVAVDTRVLRLVPQGTTYLVELDASGAVDVSVLEGVVRAERRADAARSTPEVAVICPGETLHADARPLGKPGLRQILATLAQDALIAARAPLASLGQIRKLGDQQRRGVLQSRNERLRTELLWQRPLERADRGVTVVNLPSAAPAVELSAD